MSSKVEATFHDGTDSPAPIVLVYGKPGCMPCKAVTRHLGKRGVTHQYIDVTEDPAALEWVLEHGYMSSPTVRVLAVDTSGQEVSWSGLRMDAMAALEQVYAGAAGFDTLATFDKAGAS